MSDGGGRILIRAREEQVGLGKGLKPGAYICLSVIDEGEGMDEETRARAMEPFFTTKGVGRGTGLGLSMAHGFAEQCGGKLAIQSRKGEGTTVELWLPVSEASANDAPEAEPEDVTPTGKPLVILAVDDDALVLTNTAAMLEDAGHRVLQATSGKQALQLLSEGRVDVLVTDFAMPDMNGAQLAEAARAGWPELAVLIVSGYAELPEEGVAASLPRLAKPFHQRQIARAVSDLAGPAGRGRVLPFRGRKPS
jgi:CheY-like chemotaxis protein